MLRCLDAQMVKCSRRKPLFQQAALKTIIWKHRTYNPSKGASPKKLQNDLLYYIDAQMLRFLDS